MNWPFRKKTGDENQVLRNCLNMCLTNLYELQRICKQKDRHSVSIVSEVRITVARSIHAIGRILENLK